MFSFHSLRNEYWKEKGVLWKIFWIWGLVANVIIWWFYIFLESDATIFPALAHIIIAPLYFSFLPLGVREIVSVVFGVSATITSIYLLRHRFKDIKFWKKIDCILICTLEVLLLLGYAIAPRGFAMVHFFYLIFSPLYLLFFPVFFIRAAYVRILVEIVIFSAFWVLGATYLSDK